MVASHFEASGLTGVEATACGAALVTADNGGCRDYALHGQTAFMAAPQSQERLADAVSRLLDNDVLRVRLAQAGHQLAKLLEGAKAPV